MAKKKSARAKTNVYEGMYILDSNRYGREPDAVSGQIQKAIEQAGGEILVSRLWEERRLAYPIKGHRKGTYWLAYFRLEPARLAEIQRACQLSDTILRVLFLKVDPRIVDALVAHAQAGPGGAAPPETEEAKPAEPGDGKQEDKAAEKDAETAVATAEGPGDADAGPSKE